MARINPIYSGLLLIRRIGLALGTLFFVYSAFEWIPQVGHAGAEGMAVGAAIFAFFAPMIHLGPSNREEN